jgi:hypothetical protein
MNQQTGTSGTCSSSQDEGGEIEGLRAPRATKAASPDFSHSLARKRYDSFRSKRQPITALS